MSAAAAGLFWREISAPQTALRESNAERRLFAPRSRIFVCGAEFVPGTLLKRLITPPLTSRPGRRPAPVFFSSQRVLTTGRAGPALCPAWNKEQYACCRHIYPHSQQQYTAFVLLLFFSEVHILHSQKSCSSLVFGWVCGNAKNTVLQLHQ